MSFALKRGDAYRIEFQPLRAAVECTKMKLAAWRGNGVLIIDTSDKAKRANWGIGRAKYFRTIDPETSLGASPLKRVITPFGKISI